MFKKHYTDVKEEVVKKANAIDTTVRWLITKEDGSKNYATRRFEIRPKGKIGLHSHPEEHHLYVLSGKGKINKGIDKTYEASKGDFLFIPPNEEHGMENVGDEPFVFICVIPYL